MLPLVTDWFYKPVFGMASQRELDSVKDYLKDFKHVTDSISSRLKEQDSFNEKVIAGMTEFAEQVVATMQ